MRYLILIICLKIVTGLEFPKISNVIKTTHQEIKPDYSTKEDKHLNSTQMLRKYGYPAEDHYVLTEDGYLLNMVRIPRPGRPVVLIMHGLISSSDEFISSGLHEALVYTLSNASYEVWLGNCRGNKYSRKNIHMSPDDRKFWEFSWHEIAIYDLPVMIDYALMVSKQTQLSYIGHSQGTTTLFALCAEKPEYNKKIKVFISLATITYTAHTFQPLLRALAPFNGEEEKLLYDSGLFELLPHNKLIDFIFSTVCDVSKEIQFLCITVVFSAFGFDYAQIDQKQLSVQLSHFPGGSSVRQLTHFLENTKTKKFAKYNYRDKNLEVYGQSTPPEYQLEKVTIPVAMYQGQNDYLSSLDDVKLLLPRLPNVVEVYTIPYKSFGHTDFVWAKDAKTMLYDRVVEMINRYN